MLMALGEAVLEHIFAHGLNVQPGNRRYVEKMSKSLRKRLLQFATTRRVLRATSHFHDRRHPW